MKKIISFVLAAAMSLSTLPVLADWNNDEDIMSLLSELNIMVGDDDGNLRLDDNVSRAEFAKIAVASSSYKDTVATGLKVSPFKDVSISVEVNKANEDLNDNNDNTTNNNNTSNSENNISANTNTNVNNNGNITNTIDNKDDDKANKNSVFVVNQTDNPKASGKENTGKSGKLPYAGIIKKCSIILGIIVAISGIYSYYKYRKI